MENLSNLWQLVNTASALTEVARKAQTFTFMVGADITFYLQLEYATVRITRWMQPKVELALQLRAPFGWRVATDQDDAGVYVVARRRAALRSLAAATLHAHVPYDTHLLLRLEACDLRLDGMSGTLEIAAPPTRTVILDPNRMLKG